MTNTPEAGRPKEGAAPLPPPALSHTLFLILCGILSLASGAVPKALIMTFCPPEYLPKRWMLPLDPFVYLGILLGWWTMRRSRCDLDRMKSGELSTDRRELTLSAYTIGRTSVFLAIVSNLLISGLVVNDLVRK